MDKMQTNPCKKDSPQYLKDSYARYVEAYKACVEAQKRYKEDIEKNGWLMTERERYLQWANEVERYEQALESATHNLMICRADAKGEGLLDGCFPF